MRYQLDEQQCQNLELSTRREWVLTNGVGGYAMGTASGINTRRYHGHLVAATTPPTGRVMLLAAIDAFVQTGNSSVGVSANQYPGTIYPEGYHYLRHFSVGDTAVWRYRGAGWVLEKEIRVHPGENATTITYRNVGGSPLTLTLRPLVEHRDHHANFVENRDYPQNLDFAPKSTFVEHEGITLRLDHGGAFRTPVQGWYYRFEHTRETERGLDPRDDLYCPCELRYELVPGASATLTASLGREEAEETRPSPSLEAETSLSAALREAAEKFFVQTAGRASIIAGYPWFTDWGRDTMISLPGLCLHTGRIDLARRILHDYAGQMSQGLIPNRFVEQGETPDYNTVDATLWFANATYKTLAAEWNEEFATAMLEKLVQVFEWHQRGTLFGIRVDPSDGLLTQGQAGVQLTWMDAKVGDWVVTPRHGKPVEINGLWINLLRAAEWIASRLGDSRAGAFREAAELASTHFEAKFWHEGRGHYLDTADPQDASLRPNQVLAMALPFSAMNPDHAARALDVVSRELLTASGLRTLGPNEPGYRGKFQGPLNELDAAYHQGTAWPWLLGSYATALVRFCRDRAGAKRVLRNARIMLSEYGLGGVAEVYDGDEPQRAGGCPWQAWSVAEILRAWVEDCGGD